LFVLQAVSAFYYLWLLVGEAVQWWLSKVVGNPRSFWFVTAIFLEAALETPALAGPSREIFVEAGLETPGRTGPFWCFDSCSLSAT
jgi:hypothetical protein